MLNPSQFRALTGKDVPAARPPIPGRERCLLIITFAYLLYLIIFKAAVSLNEALVTPIFPLLALLALLSRRSSKGAKAEPICQLPLTPPFLLGLGLFAYVAIAALNPAYLPDFSTGREMYWPVSHIAWLPAGINAPLEDSNPFRWMLLFGPPWFMACILWVGLRQRRSVRMLFVGMGLLFAVWGGVALLQHVLGAEKMLWLWERPRYGAAFWGSIFYANHAALFGVFGVGVSFALFLYGVRRAARKLRFAGPHLLWFGVAGLMTYATYMAQSRSGYVVLGLLWLVFTVLGFVVLFRYFRARALLFFPMPIFLIGGSFWIFLQNPDIWRRVQLDYAKTQRSYEETLSFDQARTTMKNISFRMLEANPWLGHGPGAFRYTHLQYKLPEEDIFARRRVPVKDMKTGETRWRKKSIRMWFRHAHMDNLEIPVELGVVGSSFLFGMFAWAGGVLVRHRKHLSAAAVALLATLGTFQLAAFWDFNFRNPLLVLTYVLLWVIVLKLTTLHKTTSH